MSTPTDTPSLTPTVTLIPGDGIVIRRPAFLCVIERSAPRELIREVMGLEASVAIPDRMPRRGRHLVRKLAELIATADEPVSIAFAAPDSAGIAIYMTGTVFAETDGERLEPDADEPFDRAVVWPYEGLGLYLADAVPAEPGEEFFDLVNGAVPSSGALLHTPLGLRGTEIHEIGAPPPRVRPEIRAEDPPATSSTPAPVADRKPETPARPPVVEPVAAQPEPPAPEPVPPGPMPDDEETESLTPPAPEPPAAQPFRSAALGGGEPFSSAPLGPHAPEPPAPPVDPHPGPAPVPPLHHDPLHAEPLEKRAPLPKQEHQKAATEVVKIEESRAHVHGIRCSRGHLNHPQSWLCGVCGIRMDQLTAILVEGERPPLGWLLLDNGSTYLLDEDLVIGREPGTAGRGGPKPIRVQDETGQLSRRHVEIRLVEWTVQLVDLGSANGTYVVDPLSGNRETRLPARRPHVLAPGSHVRIGGRHFIFESPHARI